MLSRYSRGKGGAGGLIIFCEGPLYPGYQTLKK